MDKLPYYECPSFNSCSATKCPLDPDIEERDYISGDPKCKAEKPTRIKIGSKYPESLKYQGLTKREWVAKRNWDRKSYAEKELAVESLRKWKKTQNP